MISALLLALAMQAQDTTRLTLQHVVERALTTHPAVASARAVVDRSAADLSDARSRRLPGLNFDAAINRFEKPMIVSPLHGLDLRNPPLFDRTPYQAGLSLNWTVFDFGRRSAQIRAQSALREAADDALTSTEQQLTAATVHAYLAVLDARQTLAARDRLVAALRAAEDRTRQLEAQGKAARVDVLRMNAEVARAQADRITIVSQLDVAEHALAQFADIPFENVHGATLAPLALADTSAVADAGLVPRALRTSSDLRELEQQSQAARAGVSAARATRLPTVQMQGAYIDRGRWAGNYAAEWQVGLAMSYPVFTGGSRASAVQRASANERLAAERVRAARLDVTQQIDQNLATLREAHARVAALESAVAQSQEVERIEKLALDVGTVVQTDYLDAEAKLYSAQASLIQARHAEIAARVDLAGTLGDLSRDWLARNVESLP
ncbi:MAG TPA: TolC family protein [Gemmatimonadaceae bacterium]|nr:TolC family protein [Gemmatimonadaceae bacterium]